MKKKQSLVVIAAGTLISLGLIGCGTNNNSVKADDGKFSGGADVFKNAILTDNETGCQYIQSKTGYSLSIIPRLDENGKPMCGKGEK